MQKKFSIKIVKPEPLAQIPYEEFFKSVIAEWGSINDEDNQDISVEITTELENGAERTYKITSALRFQEKTYDNIVVLIQDLYSHIDKNNEIIMYIDLA
ncbi:hypothetical protein [Sinanaerobacter chloroacetimidivorans]|uniref:Uncharacterized protein n=1 Tax=Sinanaerobacter chloroacetimidivorans TaxID=2818044 RepID=A0A8J7W1C8_9FIRM|nr:hypothetical protein [Sinanaerobacter chloroacetimidivorans]MBR0599022.1 hypothetical protein [Sinanaerobacter chloroacetimidivorans]